MMTKTISKRLAEYKLVFTLRLIILSLALTNLSPVTGNSQENNEPKGWTFGADRTNYKVSNTVNKTAQILNQPFPDEYLTQLKEYPGGIPEKPPVNLDFEEFMAVTAINTFKTDLPKIDLHVHLTANFASTESLRYEKAAELSAKMGVVFGIAEEINGSDIRSNDKILMERIELVKKYPLYLGLQINGPGLMKNYSKNLLDSVDYLMEDALRFPDKDGKICLLWIPGVIFEDPEEFMDRYVAYNLKVLSEPIDIWVNPTYLPISLQKRYNELWTEKRMKILIEAAVKNNIAIEINSRFQIPGKKFIQMAKAAGAHFTFGSNEHDTKIGEITWSLATAAECGLKPKDFFIPGRKLLIK